MQVYAVSVMLCGFTQSALWAYVSLRRGLAVAGSSPTYHLVRGVMGLIVPLYFLWLAVAGVREIGPTALYGAIVPTALLFLMRRLVLPRLDRTLPAG